MPVPNLDCPTASIARICSRSSSTLASAGRSLVTEWCRTTCVASPDRFRSPFWCRGFHESRDAILTMLSSIRCLVGMLPEDAFAVGLVALDRYHGGVAVQRQGGGDGGRAARGGQIGGAACRAGGCPRR